MFNFEKNSATPGSLVIVHKSAGLYLQRLSDKFGEDYYLLTEDDIQAHVDLWPYLLHLHSPVIYDYEVQI